MPTIQEITNCIEEVAPLVYQEAYDNAGLITGNKQWECKGALLCLDSTPEVIQEAIDNNCNLVIAHHPIIFKGIKSITGKSYVEQAVILAIKHDIAIYAAHTNLDNMVIDGVSRKMATKLKLQNCRVLDPKSHTLQRLITYVPAEDLESVRNVLFSAGAGAIGHYSQCSFNVEGIGTFLGDDQTNPTIGESGQFEEVKETKLEVLIPIDKSSSILEALKSAHPYEEVAYYIIPIENNNPEIGAGIVGELPQEISEVDFLNLLKKEFDVPVVRHTKFLNKTIKTVALCGGSGSFLLSAAKRSHADVYVSADFKYHEFFDAEKQLMIADIGHFESEQYTTEIFHDIIGKKFPNFALRFSEIKTNPINYF